MKIITLLHLLILNKVKGSNEGKKCFYDLKTKVYDCLEH